MAIERIGTTTEYKADGLGDTKPVLRIGGKTEAFVPNVNLSFQCESGKEQFFLNINRKSVTVDRETSSLTSEKLALTVGNETDIWHINAKGVHQLHAAGHTLKVYLTNNAPSASLDLIKTDLAGITEENGYSAADIQNDVSETDGTLTLTGTDVEWTASGAVGPFRYAVVYNDTPADPVDPLVCWWDYGSSISLANGEKFKVDFGASILTIA